MTPIEQKLAEVQVGIIRLHCTMLSSGAGKLFGEKTNQNRDELGRFASGGGGGGVDLESFAASHGGKVVNGMLVITAPKLLSSGSGSSEVGPSNRDVETLEGPATISRNSGRFYIEDDVGSRVIKPNEELTILEVREEHDRRIGKYSQSGR